MTKEYLEKKAEEWVIDCVCKDCSRYKICKSEEHCTCKECSKEKWYKGAKFGYDKANEWHYPSEGEYPKEYKDLWICFVTEDDMQDYVRGWYEYDFDEDKHIFKTVNEITQTLENVYAWKEIVPPKGQRMNIIQKIL